MKITTDHKWKEFKYDYQVPNRIRQDYLEYQTEQDLYDGWIHYRNRWYHLSNFLRMDEGMKTDFEGTWHGYLSDSVWSGVLIELSEDGEGYRIGSYYNEG